MTLPQAKPLGKLCWSLCPSPPSRILYTIRLSESPPNPASPTGRRGRAKKAWALGIMSITPSSAQGSIRGSRGWGQSSACGGHRPSGVSEANVVTLPGQGRGWTHQLWETHPWLCVSEEGLGQPGKELLRKRPRCRAPPSCAPSLPPHHGSHSPSPSPAQSPKSPSLLDESVSLGSISLGKAGKLPPLDGANCNSHSFLGTYYVLGTVT